jgi:hypothetical protein
MANASKKRVSASSLKIDTNVRCQRIFPVEDSPATKKIADLKTVGIKLSKEQAIHLARVLLAASQIGKKSTPPLGGRISENTYNVIVTSAIKK